MEWLKRLNAIKKSSGKTTEEISGLSGIPKGTLNKLFSGQTKDPQLSTIKSVVHCLGYTLDDLTELSDEGRYNFYIKSDSEREWITKYRIIGDKSPIGKEIIDFITAKEYTRCTTPKPVPAPIPLPEAVEEEERPLYNVTPIRQSDYKASAGTGAYLGPESFTIIYVKENELTSRGSFCIPVAGNSMEPYYHDNDLLIVEKCGELELGEIGIFTLDGEAYVKKLGKGQLISLNPDYKPIPMNESILLNGRVIGVMDPDWIVG